MAQNKEQLDKLLGFISTIIQDPGNEEFTKKLRALVSPNGESGAFAVSAGSNSKIDSIYELCIERIIHDQAVRFYNGFPIEELKSSLIADFVRMEHFRRKDNFDDFCSEYGYDNEPGPKRTKARKIWKSCLAQNEKLHRCFTEEQIEEMCETIQ